MISYQEALDCILNAAGRPIVKNYVVSDVLNRVVAEDVYSPISLPSFANSAMDGFAICAKDIEMATEHTPIYLNIVDSIYADGSLKTYSGKLIAVEINTGAVVPPLFDAVIKVENIEKIVLDNDKVHIKIIKPIASGTNIRQIGEDFQLNEKVLNEGTKVSANHLLALSSLGVKRLKTYALPRLVVISTGKELFNSTEKTQLSMGKIYDANTPYLLAFANELGIKASYYGHVPDDETVYKALLTDFLDKVNEPTIFISTGAVSAGSRDFIPSTLQELGAEILFHRVSIKPGKPMLFGKFTNDVYFFCLPGNPIATAVGMRFFIYPLIRKLLCMSRERPFKAKLVNVIKSRNTVTEFFKASFYMNYNNQLCVESLLDQESFKTKPMLQANSWAVLEEEKSFAAVEDFISVFPCDPNSFLIQNLGAICYDRAYSN